MIKYAIKSETGKRANNQDSVAVIQDKRFNTLAVLCDGVGGNKAGDIASQVVVNQMLASFKQKTFIDPTLEEIKFWLFNASKAALTKLISVVEFNEEYKSMSTTLVAVFLTREFAIVLTSGDSRAYIQTKDTFKRLSRDHNIKELGTSELKEMYSGEVLMSAMGDRGEILFDIINVNVSKFKKPRILLTSDGVHDFIDEEVVSKILKKGKIDNKPGALIELALENKSNDNCSCIVLEIE